MIRPVIESPRSPARILISIVLAALLFASDSIAQTLAGKDAEFRIWNLVTGPVCRDQDLVDERREQGQPPSDRICQGTDVPIRGRDGCIWSGEHRRCTWYGFEFDYENADPDEPLLCEWTRSRPGTEGNREGVRSEGLATDTFEVELEQESGRFFSPGYDLFQVVSGPWMTVRLHFECTYRGEPAFEAISGWSTRARSSKGAAACASSSDSLSRSCSTCCRPAVARSMSGAGAG
ncbi:MAG: hypothetical protein ACREK5_05320 [Gemmatimonadota bacterium]